MAGKRLPSPKAHIAEPKAFHLYRQGKSQTEIAGIIGVSEQTISNWKKKYDWDRRLAQISASTRRASDKLRQILADEIENMKDASNADAIHKLSLVLEKLDGKFDRLAFTIEVMEDFNAFLLVHYPKLLPEFHEVLAPFLNDVGNKYGS